MNLFGPLLKIVTGSDISKLVIKEDGGSPHIPLPTSGKSSNIQKTLENFNNATNITKRISDFIISYSLEDALKNLKKGDHIKANRTVYSHHAIYIGNGEVIEYNDYIIKISKLADFSDGDYIIKINDRAKYSRDKIVQRAYSRLGEEKYNIMWNNCENFADWCRNGD